MLDDQGLQSPGYSNQQGPHSVAQCKPKAMLVDPQYQGHGFRWGFHFVVFGRPVDTSWLAF